MGVGQKLSGALRLCCSFFIDTPSAVLFNASLGIRELGIWVLVGLDLNLRCFDFSTDITFYIQPFTHTKTGVILRPRLLLARLLASVSHIPQPSPSTMISSLTPQMKSIERTNHDRQFHPHYLHASQRPHIASTPHPGREPRSALSRSLLPPNSLSGPAWWLPAAALRHIMGVWEDGKFARVFRGEVK